MDLVEAADGSAWVFVAAQAGGRPFLERFGPHGSVERRALATGWRGTYPRPPTALLTGNREGSGTNRSLAALANGDVWYLNVAANTIGRVRNGRRTEFAVPFRPELIAAAPGGKTLWVAGTRCADMRFYRKCGAQIVAHVAATGSIVSTLRFPIGPQAREIPYMDFTVASNGVLWFGGFGQLVSVAPDGTRHRYGRYSDGTFTTRTKAAAAKQLCRREFSDPGPDVLAATSTGIWFSSYSDYRLRRGHHGNVGRLRDGRLVRFAAGLATDALGNDPWGGGPRSIVGGAAGSAWFADAFNLGRATANGKVTLFALPVDVGEPMRRAPAAGGSLLALTFRPNRNFLFRITLG